MQTNLRRALSHGSDKKFDWGDRGREVESDDDYRVKGIGGLQKVGEFGGIRRQLGSEVLLPC
jgi:hypothetical protein